MVSFSDMIQVSLKFIVTFLLSFLPRLKEFLIFLKNLMPTEMFDTMILLEIQIKLSQHYYLHLRH